MTVRFNALLALAIVFVPYLNAQGLINDQQKQAYAFGAGFGAQMAAQDIEIDADAFMQGFKTALAGDELALTDEELKTHAQAFQKTLMEKARAKAAAVGDENLKAGQAYLAENKGKEGVVETASGLQYLVIKEGEGAKPLATDKVKVHYTGTLIDGTVFDSSVERGEPISFALGNVIKGWTEGLQLMSVGSKYKFFIPSDLAYGARPQGRTIGPNSTLIFEVELLGINE